MFLEWDKAHLFNNKTSIMKMKLLLAFLFVFTSVDVLFARLDSDSLRILYIGNSYTYYHDLPKMVHDIAANIALDFRLKIIYKAFTPGGCTLKKHLKQADELEAIKEGIWDYVILQEQSVAPARSTDVVLRETYPYAHQLDSLVHVYNPQARVVFYMTWGHKDGCQEPHEGYPLISTYQGMQDRLIVSYLEMAYKNNAWCAPVGIVWKRVRAERPYCSLYWPDCSHPSVIGTYLAANTIFATIFQKNYQTTFTAGLESELAEYIQQVAQQTVLNNKVLLNLID